MTPQELQALRDRALADPACAPFIESRQLDKLVETLSFGRTRPNEREIGYGTIIETLGLADGNKLIRFIKAAPDLEFVVPLLDQGRLKIGSPVVQGAIQTFVGADAITQANADKLCALGKSPDPVSLTDVAAALFPD